MVNEKKPLISSTPFSLIVRLDICHHRWFIINGFLLEE